MTQHSNKKLMTIENLVKNTWLIQYPLQLKITYDHREELPSQKFKDILIENEYAIKKNSTSPGNPHKTTIIEIIHPVLGNLVRTYNLQ